MVLGRPTRFFQWSCMDVRVGLWRKLSAEEIDAFELWCWRRLLRVPWTSRRSNQSILKNISPECLLEVLMLKLKLQYFGHLLWRVDLLEKTLMCWEGLGAGAEGDDRGWDGWMASPTWWTWVWVNSGSWWWTGRPGVLRFMALQRVGHSWVTELNWTDSHSSSGWFRFQAAFESRLGNIGEKIYRKLITSLVSLEVLFLLLPFAFQSSEDFPVLSLHRVFSCFQWE